MRLLLFLFVTTPVFAVFWPIPPIDQVHPLGNNWGEYQNYGGGAYFHNGIDIITPDTSGVEVRAVAPGWVKAWGTTQAELHYRIAVCDSPLEYTERAEGWLYAHIDPARWHKNLGEEVQEGEVIGYLVNWSTDASFDHLHFARISDTGATWQRFPNPTWWFVQNPLTIIQPNTDLEPPVFENARPTWRFAFCPNNQNNRYFNPDSLVGDVDIIAKVYDKIGVSTGNPVWDKLAPYQIEFTIRRADGMVIIPWTISVQFSNRLEGSLVNVVYKDDSICDSQGNYENRAYYFILTNTDGDSIIENSDVLGKWATGLLGDGDYWVIARASDVFGNSTLDSMLVTTRNGVGVDELANYYLKKPFDLVPTIGRGKRHLSFTLTRSTKVELRLIDPLGRIVTKVCPDVLSAGDHKISLHPPSAGVYTVELIAGNRRWHKKVIFVN